ncbi:hypothetical protein L484_017177 [Morus notabilis]|uniref:Uncharacterized protein n=1 Tax=Morus notabilis TaxID=981085 RepID=W9R5Y5_9ROSA|nr:hypothetical protein L484_017177 [Morus notabilis]
MGVSHSGMNWRFENIPAKKVLAPTRKVLARARTSSSRSEIEAPVKLDPTPYVGANLFLSVRNPNQMRRLKRKGDAEI